MTADPPLVTLTSDFGLSDAYVSTIKGVLLRINPHLNIVDIAHDVPPHQVAPAVFLTQCAWRFFPTGAVHVVVVDPGVGTDRHAVALETPAGRFVGPDNGVLSSALPDSIRPASKGLTTLPNGYRAVSITNRRYMLEPLSATFHARDIFAPAAGHLACGVAVEEFGEQLEGIIALPPLRAMRETDGSLHGHVLHIDRFGNVITDVRSEDLPKGVLVIEIADRNVTRPARTYAEAAGLAPIVGSSGYVEVALANGSAARELKVEIGAPVLLRPAP